MLARFPNAAQPDALLVMPASAPIFAEVSGHACMVDSPYQCTVLHDLFDGWCAHKKAGTYAEHPEADALLRFRQHCCPDYQKSKFDLL